jgi:hypothetical protein
MMGRTVRPGVAMSTRNCDMPPWRLAVFSPVRTSAIM